MFTRVAVMAVAVTLLSGAASAHAMAAPTQTYIDVEFYAIRDTIRDTTLVSSSTSMVEAATVTSIMAMPGGAKITFTLYETPTGGEPGLWTETWPSITIPSSGLVHVMLGQITPLDPSIFTHTVLYLEVIIDDEVFSPRILVVTSGNVLLMNSVSVATNVSGTGGEQFDPLPLILQAGQVSATPITAAQSHRRRTTLLFRAPGAGDPVESATQAAHREYQQAMTIKALRNEIAQLRLQLPKSGK